MNNHKQYERPEHVDENERWINFEYSLKKWGTLLLILIVLAGIAGVFSKGYLSEGHVTSGTTEVEFERFGRIISSMDMKITFRPAGNEMTRITLGGDFMDNFEVTTLHPQPFRAYSAGKNLVLEYHMIKPEREQTLWLGLQPRRAGLGRTVVSVDEKEPVSFIQLVYP